MKCAAVAELVDARDSKSRDRKVMRVRFSPAANRISLSNREILFTKKAISAKERIEGYFKKPSGLVFFESQDSGGGGRVLGVTPNDGGGFSLAVPYTILGRTVGDFGCCDALLAGCMDRASQGQRITATDIPALDKETLRHIVELRRKKTLDEEEQAFLEYVDLLERLRAALASASVP
jgi:hypothetical protein